MANDFYSITPSEALARLRTHSASGLKSEEAARRLKEYGPNELKSKSGPSIIVKFLAQFKDFMILVLIAAAVISFVTSSLEGNPDYAEPLIILAIVVLNALIGVIQEARAERTLEALKQLAAPHAIVIRDGESKEIDAVELVPGDIILLEAGRNVPADARLLSAYSLTADESALTGESTPVEKNPQSVLGKDTPLADRKNMIFSSTTISAGHGMAVITATAMNTEVGNIAAMLFDTAIPETPLQQRLAKAGRFLAVGALAVCVIMFIIGMLQGRRPYDMFMTSVSLAVSSIPEGLPCIVTIMLSLGVQRMVKKNAIVRKLPAVETLGSATYICSDKTGTLTQNKMTVEACASPDISYDSVAADSFTNAQRLPLLQMPFLPRLLSMGSLCTGETKDSTELAIINALKKIGLDDKLLLSNCKKIFELPFDSARKCMSTVHELGSSNLVITKGAIDFILGKCTHCTGADDLPEPLTSRRRKQINDRLLQMSFAALRVIGIAYKIVPRTAQIDSTEVETKLTFLGMIGIIDPPREGIRESIMSCRLAGITPVMITGDHIGTACAIASKIGIIEKKNLTQKDMLADFAVTGEQLERISQEELEKIAKRIRVYARVSPAHKVRIVKALQKGGEVVAMTGDGVNDAPALRSADIGCAMGITGTDVAKNASDMILTDDNFATIVAAVKEGRGIYGNIKKAVHFLLSCNIGEIITIFTAISFGLPSPLLPIQLLWVNLITDSLPAIALGVEPVTDSIMRQPPVKRNSGIFNRALTVRIALEGAMIGFLSLSAYILGGKIYGQTMAFAVLSLSQLFHAFNIRSEESLFKIGLLSNPRLFIAFIIGCALQISVISFAPAAAVFGVICLDMTRWLTVIGLSIIPIFVLELQKFVSNHFKH